MSKVHLGRSNTWPFCRKCRELVLTSGRITLRQCCFLKHIIKQCLVSIISQIQKWEHGCVHLSTIGDRDFPNVTLSLSVEKVLAPIVWCKQNLQSEENSESSQHHHQPRLSTVLAPPCSASVSVQYLVALCQMLRAHTTDAEHLCRRVWLMICVQDLTNYHHEKMVTKALYILNKYFSSTAYVFKIANESQV